MSISSKLTLFTLSYRKETTNLSSPLKVDFSSNNVFQLVLKDPSLYHLSFHVKHRAFDIYNGAGPSTESWVVSSIVPPAALQRSHASKSSVTHLRAAALWKRLIYRRCDLERSSGPAVPINHGLAICLTFEREPVLPRDRGKSEKMWARLMRDINVVETYHLSAMRIHLFKRFLPLIRVQVFNILESDRYFILGNSDSLDISKNNSSFRSNH